MAETPDTDNFGLTRVGEGENLSKNGFAALDLDRVTLDDLLYALVEHTHDASPRLADPAGAPSLIGRPTGGSLPPNTTLYYRVSYIDRWGLETVASTEASITTSSPIRPPEAVAATIETSSGILGPGLYAYVATYVTANGGETTAGLRAEVRITEGSTNRIRMDHPDLIPGATAVRMYRMRPGQTQYYFLYETSQDIYYDDGIQEDPTVVPPAFNSTNAANSVEVIVPGGVLPPGVFGWKLYRSVTPGTYSGFNLVHLVVEGTTEIGDDIRPSWVDTGEALQRGEPRQKSATVGGGKIIDLSTFSGRFPLNALPRGSRNWDTFVPGAVTLGRTYARFDSNAPMTPTQIAAYFLTPPTTTPTGAQVSFQVVDSTGKFVDMRTDGTNGNYYVVEFPLTDAGIFEAEKGDDNPNAPTPIVTDLKASNGQAVEIDVLNEYIEYDVGVLDKGRYAMYVIMRKASPGPAIIDDISFSALSTGATPLLNEKFFNVALQDFDNYTEVGPLYFNARGDGPVRLRVGKATNEAAKYLVDRIRYRAELLDLAAGPISLRAEVGDIAGQEYPDQPPPAGPHLRFNNSHAIIRSTVDQAATPVPTTVTVSTSDLAAINILTSVDQPWLTVSPTTANAATQTFTLAVDWASLSPGERAVATLTASNGGATTTHLSDSIQIVALRAPTTTGADVNITVHY